VGVLFSLNKVHFCIAHYEIVSYIGIKQAVIDLRNKQRRLKMEVNQIASSIIELVKMEMKDSNCVSQLDRQTVVSNILRDIEWTVIQKLDRNKLVSM